MRPDFARLAARHLRADPMEHAALAHHLSSLNPVTTHTMWRTDFEDDLREGDLTPENRRLLEGVLRHMDATDSHAATIDPDDLNALLWFADEGIVNLTPTERETINRTLWGLVAQVAEATGKSVDHVADTILTDFTHYEDDPWWTTPNPQP